LECPSLRVRACVCARVCAHYTGINQGLKEPINGTGTLLHLHQRMELGPHLYRSKSPILYTILQYVMTVLIMFTQETG
jgi:hypothetical protein